MEVDDAERRNGEEHVRTGAVIKATHLSFVPAKSSFLSHRTHFHMALTILSKDPAVPLHGDELNLGLLQLMPSTSPSPGNAAASEDIQLGKVLEVFPDISYDHVFALFTTEMQWRPQFPGAVTDITERIVEKILHQLPYPKEKDLKRKRDTLEPDVDETRWEIGPDVANNPVYSRRVLVSLLLLICLRLYF